MNKKPAVTSVVLTAEDRKIICKLKRSLEPEHGKLTATGVIRIALRITFVLKGDVDSSSIARLP
jgi:hypothetical protein